jgi:hypothetical protein
MTDVDALLEQVAAALARTGFSGALPIGGAVRDHAWIALPHGMPGGRHRTPLTGRPVETAAWDGRCAVPAAEVLADFPATVLEHEKGER